MNGAEAEAAARLLERLLSDPDYRESFRAYPVVALREAGLQSVAEEMAMGGGKVLDTLDERESRSSLAGVFMAAALEGAAILDFSRDVVPHLDELPDSVGKVLSRVHLPAVAEAQAATPPAQGVERIAAGAAAGEFPAVTPEQAAAAAQGAQAPEQVVQPAPMPEPARPVQAAAAAVAESGSSGSGVQALLSNEQVTFDANGMADMKAGKMDPRIVSLLTAISQDHKVTVSATVSDHDKLTSNGSISNHYYGRAVDISVVDGQAVSPGNAAAREVAMALSSLPASIRPSEVGSPWDLPGTADFTDGAHQDHLHIAFDDPIASGWKPPEDPAASGGGVVEDQVAVANAPAVSDTTGDGADDSADGGDEPGGLEDPGGDTDAEADAESDGDDADDNDSVADDPSDEQEEDEDDEADEADSGDDGDHDDSSDTGSEDTDDSDGSDGGEDSGESGGGSGSGTDGDGSADGGGSGAVDGGGQIDLGDVAGSYPGDDAGQAEIAAWMGSAAQKRGLPPELPVMAGLVESGLRNLSGGDADSVGFFQMRVSIWNNGAYSGYPDKAELQLKWFLDHAVAVKQQRIAAGQSVNDPGSYGEWIADVERPAAQYRGRYQLRLEEARGLLRDLADSGGGGSGTAGARAEVAVATAKKYLGTPYLWGGSTPQTGFDCSGLVQWAYAKAGIQIPRVSQDQILASNGKAVNRKHLVAGDLVFFRDSSGDVHHVGMSLGGDKFIHAPHTGDVVKISSLNEPYYAQQFTGGRRFDQGAQAAAAAVGTGDEGQAAAVDADAARSAEAALVRDAAEAQRPGTLLFEAVQAQELSNEKEARRSGVS